jgi:acetolactate decarboxylase
MKGIMKKTIWLFLGLIIAGVTGCTSTHRDTLTQVSTIDALLAGVYDGHLSCRELINYGDFGIGTFNGLDGEMVLLNGKMHQIKADGHVYSPPLETTTPFAAVSHFDPETTFAIESDMNYTQLRDRIDSESPQKNLFCAIKIQGRFAKMKTRSVPGQTKPYPPLVEVTKNQPVFEMENIAGTIIGFRCPSYIKGINVPGYHLHFISDDLKKGGHILEFIVQNATADIDIYSKLFLILPEKNKAFDQTDLKLDRINELKKVEQ